MLVSTQNPIFRSFVSLLAASTLVISVSSCAPSSKVAGSDEEVSSEFDPLEGFNRVMHSINYTLDGLLFRPIASIYRGVVPEVVRHSVSNFLANLDQPVVFVNSVLQGDLNNAGNTIGKFVINTTVGVAGLFDVASEVGVHNRNEDFGQTLGSWGVGPGPYIVLPVLGPSDARDLLGKGVDYVIDPLTTPWNNWLNNEWQVARAVAVGIDFRARNYTIINNTYDNSVDSYSAFRSMYLQHRAAVIRNETGGKNHIE